MVRVSRGTADLQVVSSVVHFFTSYATPSTIMPTILRETVTTWWQRIALCGLTMFCIYPTQWRQVCHLKQWYCPWWYLIFGMSCRRIRCDTECLNSHCSSISWPNTPTSTMSNFCVSWGTVRFQSDVYDFMVDVLFIGTVNKPIVRIKVMCYYGRVTP